MITIWKYPIPIVDSFIIDIPKSSIVRLVECQGLKNPFMWIELNTEEEKVTREFRIFGTGYNQHVDEGRLYWVGSFQTPPFVWHLYEKGDN